MPVQVTMTGFEDVLYSKDGEFAKLYSAFKSKLPKDKVQQFSKLGAEERVKVLVGAGEPWKVEPGSSIKNLEKALELKEKGNDLFRQRNYGEAYKSYTQSLQHCPVQEENPTDPINKPYSIIWANRSAALDGAGLYAAAIHDIDMALKYGYPRELWYKLYKRKGHAAIKMKQYLVAREALEISIKNIGRSDIKKEKDRDTYRLKIRKQMTIFNVTKELYNLEEFCLTCSVLASGTETDRGISRKLKFEEDGAAPRHLVAADAIDAEDVLVAVDPYVVVVNVSGGRAGGKICPFRLDKMFAPVPCPFGSEELFGSAQARDAAAAAYHQYEWRLLGNLTAVGLLERAKLALRMVTVIRPEDVAKVASQLGRRTEELAEEEIRTAVRTFNLPLPNISEEESLVSSMLALYLLRNLAVSGYVRSPSLPAAPTLSQEEVEIFNLLQTAVLVALRHTSPIELLDVPKCKSNMMENEVTRDPCGFGVYPDLPQLRDTATGPKSLAIQWFVEKKMVFSSFRKLEKGSPILLFSDPALEPETQPKPVDMITFRCANELCSNSFPLKENTKEKIVSCPLEDCGIKTNIWERLKLIQRLKKDFASAKEEFVKGEVSLARDILKDTIEEWDRIILRPYKEVTQLEALYVKSLLCDIGDNERKLVEGNQLGLIANVKKKTNIMPVDEENTDTALVKM